MRRGARHAHPPRRPRRRGAELGDECGGRHAGDRRARPRRRARRSATRRCRAARWRPRAGEPRRVRVGWRTRWRTPHVGYRECEASEPGLVPEAATILAECGGLCYGRRPLARRGHFVVHPDRDETGVRDARRPHPERAHRRTPGRHRRLPAKSITTSSNWSRRAARRFASLRAHEFRAELEELHHGAAFA